MSREQESSLLARLAGLPFTEAEYLRYTARRRIVSYGGRYDFNSRTLISEEPVPAFLNGLRERAANWANLAAEALTHSLINEYRPATPLGWHRDAPQFEDVVGVSLGSEARMRLRPYPHGKAKHEVIVLDLEPRSIYAMQGPARWAWQHCVSPTKALRYSITFRTLRRANHVDV